MTGSLPAPCTRKLQVKVRTDSLPWSQPVSIKYFALNIGVFVINRPTQEWSVSFSIYMCSLEHLSLSHLNGLSRTFQSTYSRLLVSLGMIAGGSEKVTLVLPALLAFWLSGEEASLCCLRLPSPDSFLFVLYF